MINIRFLIACGVVFALGAPIRANDTMKTGSITLELDDVPLVSVLNMIASQNRLNLVISGDVKGDVTMRLENVNVATALDAVLTANGYNYFLKDDIIVVKTAEAEAAGELDSRLLTLKYLDPITAKKALESRISAKGKVVVLDLTQQGATGQSTYQANRLLVTDYPNLLDGLVALVEAMDIPERTILIEAKIIETTLDSKSSLGIVWPHQVETKLTGAEIDTKSETTAGTSVSNAGYYNPTDGRWTWGKLTVTELSVVLNALNQDGNSRLVSDPRITTLENHEAEFKFETIIPIQTVNRFTEGAATSDIVTFEDKEVGISLKVTPRINENGQVTMDVAPKVEDIIGYAGSTENQKPITASRSIQTRITVADGETVALGGLIKENNIETIQRVPLLGHIPIIGRLLFSSKKMEKTSTDLTILITPHILK
jgi:type IV pilus secretin PilQ/predicted competence protein